MNTERITATANELVTRFGLGAHQAIDLYRTGGQRLAETVGQRWDDAFKQASPQLTPETRRNARHARQVFGSYYTKALALSADGAGITVDTVVGATLTALDRAASQARARSHAA